MTPDDYAIEFCNSNDVPFATDSKKYRALVQIIATAVADEREDILSIADELEFKPSKWSDLLTAIRARK